MKNLVAVVALFISVGGIFVSLAREEMRCYLGLSSVECGVVPQKTSSPVSEPETAKETEKHETSDRKPEPSHATTEQSTEAPKTVEEKPTEIPKTVEKQPEKSHTEPTKSQPIEVIPPPEAANKSEGQSIEVIPPPEEQQH